MTNIEDIPTHELSALVEQGLPLAEYLAEMARRDALSPCQGVQNVHT